MAAGGPTSSEPAVTAKTDHDELAQRNHLERGAHDVVGRGAGEGHLGAHCGKPGRWVECRQSRLDGPGVVAAHGGA